MRVIHAWQEASLKLKAQGIEDASLEAELLLRHVLKVERAYLYTRLGGELTNLQLNELNQLMEQRMSHEPNAYLRGSQEFYGLELYVDRRVLIPRPETELLVEKALEVARKYATLSLSKGDARELLIADIGTGSGAVAIALAVHLPQATIYAIDISPQALDVALINCQRHGVAERVQLLLGDLLEPLPQAVDIVVANLPYVSDGEWINLMPEVSQYEPRIALSGGADGLDCIRRLLSQVAGKLHPNGALLLEVGVGQGQAVSDMARRAFLPLFAGAQHAAPLLIPDLAGIPRVVVGQNPGALPTGALNPPNHTQQHLIRC